MNKIIKEILEYVIIIVVALLIKFFIVTPIRVDGDSMYPTLLNGDIMILNEIGYHLNGVERFDIVVCRTKSDPIIKRVIGLPGETVKYSGGKLYINDEIIEEDFKHAYTDAWDLSMINESVIPKGYYFVVGDNRNDSTDSRIIGLIKASDIRGKTDLIIYPFNRFGRK